LERARNCNIATQPPFFPASFLDYVAKHDPVSTGYTSASPEANQFYGKKVFAVAGGKDRLVPWVHSERFFGELEVGEGTKDVFIDPEAGHEVTPAMVDAVVEWLWKNALRREGQASLWRLDQKASYPQRAIVIVALPQIKVDLARNVL
jgi:hypothetical protein